MSNPEVPSNPEKPASPWQDVFEVLSLTAKDKLSDHGRKVPSGSIDLEFLYQYTGLVVRVESSDINNWLEVTMKPSRNNSDKHDVRPPKGINMEWATGEDINYHKVKFTVSRRGVSAYGLPVHGDEEVKLELLQNMIAARQFADLAQVAIDQAKLPHLF